MSVQDRCVPGHVVLCCSELNALSTWVEEGEVNKVLPPNHLLQKKNVPFFLEMYVPEPTNIPIEKTNHREIDMEVPLWPTPSENDIIHLPRGKCQSQQIRAYFTAGAQSMHSGSWVHPLSPPSTSLKSVMCMIYLFFNFQNFF